MKVHTVQFVNMSDVLDTFGITDANAVEDFMPYLDGVSFGDASYTMMGNTTFLVVLTYFLSEEWEYTTEQLKRVHDLFWYEIPRNVYINLEG